MCPFIHPPSENWASCWVLRNNRRQAEGAKPSGPRVPCIPGEKFLPTQSPGDPSSLPNQCSTDSLLPPSPASSISPLYWVIPDTIKHAMIFPILREESSLHHTFLFPASLFLFPFIVKPLERVILLYPLPSLQCLLNPPHRALIPVTPSELLSLRSPVTSSLLNSIVNS